MDYRIRGYCPMGCGETLFVAAGGYITCSNVPCPNPTAVSDILDDRESEHVVVLDADGWTIRHPLRERLGDALLTCDIQRQFEALQSAPIKHGRYRIRQDEAILRFEELPS